MRPWRGIIIFCVLLWGSLDAFAIRAVHSETPCTGDFGGTVSRARYYNPQIGRFWTMDTFQGNNEDPLSLHKYLYCHDSPLRGTDPSGHDIELENGAVGIKAHAVFGLYCALSRGIPCIPGATLKTLLPEYFDKEHPFGNLKPDLVDADERTFYELKPISHKDGDREIQYLDHLQMSDYDIALNAYGFHRQPSIEFVTPGTIAGSFEHEGAEYAVLLYPEGTITSCGFDGKGLIYYEVKPIQEIRNRKFVNELLTILPFAIAPYKIAQSTTGAAQAGRIIAARALAKPVGAAVGAQVETRLSLQVLAPM